MDFCALCDNMLYARTAGAEPGGATAEEEAGASEMYCKNCGLVTPMPTDAPKLISHMAIGDLDVDPAFFISKHVKDDPTLPHLYSLPCPNAECPGAQSDVVYIKHDSPNMKYVYICVHCDTIWKK